MPARVGPLPSPIYAALREHTPLQHYLTTTRPSHELLHIPAAAGRRTLGCDPEQLRQPGAFPLFPAAIYGLVIRGPTADSQPIQPIQPTLSSSASLARSSSARRFSSSSLAFTLGSTCTGGARGGRSNVGRQAGAYQGLQRVDHLRPAAGAGKPAVNRLQQRQQATTASPPPP